MKFSVRAVDPALIQSILREPVAFTPLPTARKIRHRNRTIGELVLNRDVLQELVSEHDLNHELKKSAWWPFALEHTCAALLEALTRDVEHLLPLYLELLHVGEFNDLLFGADRLVVLDLLDELPPEVSARWLRAPIISWNLQYLADHGTPQQKRRVKKIRRAAVPDGRGAPTKPRQDHAVTKIDAAVRAAEGVLKEPFQRCVGWRKAGGYKNCTDFMTRELKKDGCDSATIRAVVSSRNLFAAATRYVAAQLGGRNHRSIAEMARRGKKELRRN